MASSRLHHHHQHHSWQRLPPPLCGAEGRGGAPGEAAGLCSAEGAALAASPALEAIIDAGGFDPAPCLCCYRARSRGAARAAGEALSALLAFYRATPEGAPLFLRLGREAQEAEGRDVLPAELARIRARLAEAAAAAASSGGAGAAWPAEARAASAAAEGVVLAVPPCAPGTLWAYSTPAARRLLRHLARQARRGGEAPVAVALLSAARPGVAPRWPGRVYEARQAGATGADLARRAAVLLLRESRAASKREFAGRAQKEGADLCETKGAATAGACPPAPPAPPQRPPAGRAGTAATGGTAVTGAGAGAGTGTAATAGAAAAPFLQRSAKPARA